MLNREQQKEILGLAVAALALLVLFALVPIGWLGDWGAQTFPSGNLIGRVGAFLRAITVAFAGVAALALPVLMFVGGLRLTGWLDGLKSLRAAILSVGLLILVPPFLQIVGLGPEWTGWLGQTLGAPLEQYVGWLGGSLVLASGLVILSVATLRFNPLKPLAALMARLGRGAGKGALMAGAAGARGAKQVVAKAREAATEPVTDETGEAIESGEEPAALPPGVAEEDPGDLPAALGDELEPDDADDSWDAPWAETPPEDPMEPESELTPESEDDEDVAPGEQRSLPGIVAEGHLPDPASAGALRMPLPPLDLLTASEVSDSDGATTLLDRQGEILIEKLASFGVEATLGGRTTGPVVTQFEVIPASGVKVSRIANLEADLALAMKARSIRIVAPIPGKGAVGVEIPNPESQVIYLRDILESPAFQRSKARLPLALGKDLNGRPFVTDLAKMPHVLIAGATGSGKSVCVNTIITSLAYRHSPETLRFLMVDPKMVELSSYRKLPHLRHSVVTDPKDAAGVLKWAVLEMNRRYQLLSENGVRSIAEFNDRVRSGGPLRRIEAEGPEGDPDRWLYTDGVLPYVVVVIDELADLMMTVQGDVEKPLTLLAQKARAIGIHLIVATQRPSVNVITGLIKANFPSRIAFRVASKTDSRTIIDQNGADTLLGNGDMLFLPPGQNEPIRAQGAFIPTEDTDALISWYEEQVEIRNAALEEAGAPEVVEDGAEDDILEVVRALEGDAEPSADDEDGFGDWDDLFQEAAELCISNGGGSTSFLQRKLKIGYGRAARLSDQLEEAGVLGPSAGAKGREVLMTLPELAAFMSGADLQAPASPPVPDPSPGGGEAGASPNAPGPGPSDHPPTDPSEGP